MRCVTCIGFRSWDGTAVPYTEHTRPSQGRAGLWVIAEGRVVVLVTYKEMGFPTGLGPGVKGLEA